MLKYQVGPYKKPKALLRTLMGKRLTPKSEFLKRVERRVRANVREQELKRTQTQAQIDYAAVEARVCAHYRDASVSTLYGRGPVEPAQAVEVFPTGHRTAIRIGLPSPSWRKIIAAQEAISNGAG